MYYIFHIHMYLFFKTFYLFIALLKHFKMFTKQKNVYKKVLTRFYILPAYPKLHKN
jgi:hypothetical protein